MNSRNNDSITLLISRFILTIATAFFDIYLIYIFLDNMLKFNSLGIFMFLAVLPSILLYPLVSKYIYKQNMKKVIIFYMFILFLLYFAFIVHFSSYDLELWKLLLFTSLIKLFTIQVEIIYNFMILKISNEEGKYKNVIISYTSTCIAYILALSISFIFYNNFDFFFISVISALCTVFSITIICNVKGRYINFSNDKINFVADCIDMYKYLRISADVKIVKLFFKNSIISFLFLPTIIVALPMGLKNIGLSFENYISTLLFFILGISIPILKKDLFKDKNLNLNKMITIIFILVSFVGVYTSLIFFMIVPKMDLVVFLCIGIFFAGILYSLVRVKMINEINKSINKEYYNYYYIYEKLISLFLVSIGILTFALLVLNAYIGFILFIIGLFGIALTMTVKVKLTN